MPDRAWRRAAARGHPPPNHPPPNYRAPPPTVFHPHRDAPPHPCRTGSAAAARNKTIQFASAGPRPRLSSAASDAALADASPALWIRCSHSEDKCGPTSRLRLEALRRSNVSSLRHQSNSSVRDRYPSVTRRSPPVDSRAVAITGAWFPPPVRLADAYAPSQCRRSERAQHETGRILVGARRRPGAIQRRSCIAPRVVALAVDHVGRRGLALAGSTGRRVEE